MFSLTSKFHDNRVNTFAPPPPPLPPPPPPPGPGTFKFLKKKPRRNRVTFSFAEKHDTPLNKASNIIIPEDQPPPPILQEIIRLNSFVYNLSAVEAPAYSKIYFNPQFVLLVVFITAQCHPFHCCIFIFSSTEPDFQAFLTVV